MKFFKYFKINDTKFNYSLEFDNYLDEGSEETNDIPLIEYLENIGINIPHYCYHRKLSISGNCRMCLVEFKNSPKPVISCALSAKSCLNSSEVYTSSPLVRKSRENILEFLLLNHPLDCPICDQGGECDLQEQSFFFGMTKKRFYSYKRIVSDKNLGLIVKTVMTRCIHCTRCVRFSKEIAGVEDLGMFGRGLNSEIGTYIQKTFKSELSGNVIDLCPVGALTSKINPFMSRNWELKKINTIDFSDGFGLSINVSVKNNKIARISPGLSNKKDDVVWISDKTRFSFDGMFSYEQMSEGFIIYNKKYKNCVTWKKLLSEIATTLYFEDHLSKHFLKPHQLLVVFNSNISMNDLGLLLLFSKKYFFISLKTSETFFKNNDLESNITLNAISRLKISNLCVLFGINPRYEGSFLKSQLRRRHLKGNFEVISVGSSLNTTIPIQYFGLNMKTIKSSFEGNNFLSRKILNSNNPLLIFSSKIYGRIDFPAMSTLVKNSKSMLSYRNFNVLSSTINETGLNYIKGFKPITNYDLEKNNGLYFLNSNIDNSLKFHKLLNLKVLNYSFSNKILNPSYCFENNNSTNSEISNFFLNVYSIFNYINLPNSVFFNSNGTYLTTQGHFKKVVKFIPSSKQTKEDWQVLRKIFSYLNNVNFSNNEKYDKILCFSNSTQMISKKILDLIYLASRFSLSKYLINFPEKISGKFQTNKNTIKLMKLKFNLTNLKIWIRDFYTGGFDNYTTKSLNMSSFSKSYRYQNINFN